MAPTVHLRGARLALARRGFRVLAAVAERSSHRAAQHPRPLRSVSHSTEPRAGTRPFPRGDNVGQTFELRQGCRGEGIDWHRHDDAASHGIEDVRVDHLDLLRAAAFHGVHPAE